MRAFLFFLCLHSLISFANDTSQKPLVRIQLLDKFYSETTNEELPIGKDLYYGNLQINIQKCIMNNNGEAFAMILIKDSGDTFYEGWMPVSEYATFPLQHVKYDISVVGCTNYETITE